MLGFLGILMFNRLFAPIRRSLQAKLSVLVAASVASAVLLGAVASAWREADRQFVSKSLELDGVAKALAASIAAPMSARDSANVGRALTAIGRIHGMNFVQALDSEGQSVFQFGNGVVLESANRPVRANEDLGLFSRLNLRNYMVETPVISGGVEIGTLRLVADLSDLSSALARSIASALLAAALAAGAGFLVFSRLQGRILHPIRDLTAAMLDVQTSHDFSRMVTKQSDDETGLMVGAFNEMLAQIRSRDARISRQLEHLEQEVEKRTAELKFAKLAAEAANASKSDFLATMSHEIRTPLNGIMVTAELMSTSELPPQAQRHADTIVASGQSLLTIINDILDLSKIESGRLELEQVPIDPAGVVHQVLSLFAARAASKNIDLACYVGPRVPQSVSADPVRVAQVLSNLVNNALKFTSEGSVSIELDIDAAGPTGGANDATLLFRVIDTGIGIPNDKLETIFEAFAQADQTTTRKYGGTGIGLSISRKLVAAMGSEIIVTSEVGQGSCFSFAVSTPVLQAAACAPSIGPASRLIEMDLPSTATGQTLARMLTDRGFDVVHALNGGGLNPVGAVAARITTASRLNPSAPATRRGKRAPFCLVVANAGEQDAIRLVEAGRADDVVTKPLSVADVNSIALAIASERRGPLSGSAPKRARAEPLPRFSGAHVLAAEDSLVNRQILAEALSRLDVRVTLVEDGQQAVDAVAKQTFDLVLMDCSMPVMDGFDATRAIRAREAELSLAQLPIVALTAHVTGAQANAWRGAGMSDYVSKPFTLKTLSACLERWMPATRPSKSPCDTSEQGPRGGITQASAAALPALNLDVMEDIRAMQLPGDDLVGRICGLFRFHAPSAIDRIADVIKGADRPAIASAVHALKSLCRNVGAERLAATLDTLEDAARGDGALPDEADLSLLRDQLAEVLVELDAMPPAQDAPEAKRA